MTKESDKFERQIHRIHELMEGPGATVCWNDKIPDPDNLEQARQIDVTINRDGLLTLVECRFRKAVQNVNWIEELIGRRQSLKADAVIAVSVSGFTKGAVKKAKEYGIVLRDAVSLTEEEISRWGSKTEISLNYVGPTNFVLHFTVSPRCNKRRSTKLIEECIKKNYKELVALSRSLLYEVAESLQRSGNSSIYARTNLDSVSLGFNRCGVSKCELRVTAFQRIEPISTAGVVGYDEPSADALFRDNYAQIVSSGDFQITHSNGEVGHTIDLSGVRHPKDYLFVSVIGVSERTAKFRNIVLLNNNLESNATFSFDAIVE